MAGKRTLIFLIFLAYGRGLSHPRVRSTNEKDIKYHYNLPRFEPVNYKATYRPFLGRHNNQPKEASHSKYFNGRNNLYAIPHQRPYTTLYPVGKDAGVDLSNGKKQQWQSYHHQQNAIARLLPHKITDVHISKGNLITQFNEDIHVYQPTVAQMIDVKASSSPVAVNHPQPSKETTGHRGGERDDFETAPLYERARSENGLHFGAKVQTARPILNKSTTTRLIESTKHLISGKDVLDLNEAIDQAVRESTTPLAPSSLTQDQVKVPRENITSSNVIVETLLSNPIVVADDDFPEPDSTQDNYVDDLKPEEIQDNVLVTPKPSPEPPQAIINVSSAQSNQSQPDKVRERDEVIVQVQPSLQYVYEDVRSTAEPQLESFNSIQALPLVSPMPSESEQQTDEPNPGNVQPTEETVITIDLSKPGSIDLKNLPFSGGSLQSLLDGLNLNVGGTASTFLQEQQQQPQPQQQDQIQQQVVPVIDTNQNEVYQQPFYPNLQYFLHGQGQIPILDFPVLELGNGQNVGTFTNAGYNGNISPNTFYQLQGNPTAEKLIYHQENTNAHQGSTQEYAESEKAPVYVQEQGNSTRNGDYAQYDLSVQNFDSQKVFDQNNHTFQYSHVAEQPSFAPQSYHDVAEQSTYAPQPYPVEQKVEVPVGVTRYVDQTYPVPVTVEPVPYRVGNVAPNIIKEQSPVEVLVPQPIQVPGGNSVFVSNYNERPVEKTVEKPVPPYYPVPVNAPVPVSQPVYLPVEVPQPYPVEMTKYLPPSYSEPKPYPIGLTNGMQVPVSHGVPAQMHVYRPLPVEVPNYFNRPTYPMFVNKYKNNALRRPIKPFKHNNLMPPYAGSTQLEHIKPNDNRNLKRGKEINMNKYQYPMYAYQMGASDNIPQSYQFAFIGYQPQGQQGQDVQYAYINPNDYIGLVPPKPTTPNKELVRTQRRPRQSLDNIRMEYGFKPPLRPSLQIDEDGNPIEGQ